MHIHYNGWMGVQMKKLYDAEKALDPSYIHEHELLALYYEKFPERKEGFIWPQE